MRLNQTNRMEAPSLSHNTEQLLLLPIRQNDWILWSFLLNHNTAKPQISRKMQNQSDGTLKLLTLRFFFPENRGADDSLWWVVCFFSPPTLWDIKLLRATVILRPHDRTNERIKPDNSNRQDFMIICTKSNLVLSQGKFSASKDLRNQSESVHPILK